MMSPWFSFTMIGTSATGREAFTCATYMKAPGIGVLRICFFFDFQDILSGPDLERGNGSRANGQCQTGLGESLARTNRGREHARFSFQHSHAIACNAMHGTLRSSADLGWITISTRT